MRRYLTALLSVFALLMGYEAMGHGFAFTSTIEKQDGRKTISVSSGHFDHHSRRFVEIEFEVQIRKAVRCGHGKFWLDVVKSGSNLHLGADGELHYDRGEIAVQYKGCEGIYIFPRFRTQAVLDYVLGPFCLGREESRDKLSARDWSSTDHPECRP